MKFLLQQTAKECLIYQRFLLVLTIMLFASFGAMAQTVTSDKDDYAPGEIATVTGSGWTEDQVVHVEFKEEPDYPDYHVYDVDVDAEGNWVIKYQVETRHIGVKFTVNAKGAQSGFVAQTVFTDANVEFKASGLPNGTSVTVRYRVGSNTGQQSTFNFSVPDPSASVPVQLNQSIYYNFDNVIIGGITYSAPGGSLLVDKDPNGKTKYTITADYTASCTIPTITTQPASTTTTFTYGSDATFTIVASGTATLAYQWQVNTGSGFANISGATSASLTVTKPTVSMNGNQYRCVVSNSCGSATSNAATLNINKATATVILANLSHTYDGSNKAATATTNASGTSTYTFAYTKAGSPIAASVVKDAGSYGVTATLVNDNFSGSASGTLTINPAQATISITGLDKTYNGSAQGATVTTSPEDLAVKVTYDGSGTVPTAAGSYAVVAVLNNSNYSAVNGTGTLVIDKANQHITFATLEDKTYGNDAFSLGATASSGLAVSYSSSKTDVATVSGSTVTIVGAGTTTITAIQAGNNNYNAATAVLQTLKVDKATATLTLANLTHTYDGNVKSATASTSPANLTGVSISNNGKTNAGTYAVTASLVNTNYEATSVTGNLVIRKANQVISWDAPTAITYGTALSTEQLNATVAGVTGGSEPGDLSYSPVAGTVLNADSHTLTASAAETGNYNEATKTVSVTVNKATPEISWSPSPLAAITYGTDMDGKLNATAIFNGNPVAGTFVYKVGSSVVTSATKLNASTSPYTIDVAFTPTDENNYNGQTGSNTVKVNKASQTITITKGAPESAVYNTTFTVAATASSDLAVSYGSDGTLSNSGATYTMNAGTGSGTVTYSQAGNENYNAATVVTETVNAAKASQSITFTSLAAKTYGDASFTLGATAGSGLTVSYASSNTDVATISGNTVSIVGAGTTIITASQAGNANYEAATDVLHNLTVAKALLTITSNNIATPTQYSDILPAFTATFTGFVNDQTLATSGVTGAPSFTTSASLSGTGAVLSAPGNYSITPAKGTLLSDNYSFSYAGSTFAVTSEDARVTYTGAVFASTSSTTSSTATVTLSATIQDITAVSGDEAYDANAGDIRNAKVTFINRENGTVLASNIPVGLVSSGDTKTGTATANVSLTTGNSSSATYTIGIIVSGYYTRNVADDNTIVTISKPLSDFITGGGFVTLTNATGLIEPKQGTKNNFGFNVKYNKGGTNLQGNINTIVRGENGRVYQVKGNVMSSLSVNTSKTTDHPYPTAVFNGKANIQDITNPAAPVAVDGNATLQVTMTDAGEPGTSDKIAITVWSKAGGVWFANNWSGTKTVEQLLAKGNLKVSSNSSFGNTTLATTTKSKSVVETEVVAPDQITFTSYPNPFADEATIAFSLTQDEAYSLEIYDMKGQLVKKLQAGKAQAGSQVQVNLKERYLPTGVYLLRLSTGTGVKHLRIVRE